jgi:hypothetical protein
VSGGRRSRGGAARRAVLRGRGRAALWGPGGGPGTGVGSGRRSGGGGAPGWRQWQPAVVWKTSEREREEMSRAGWPPAHKALIPVGWR